jgi:hypothetical protein
MQYCKNNAQSFYSAYSTTDNFSASEYFIFCHSKNGTVHLNVMQKQDYRGQLGRGKQNSFFKQKNVSLTIVSNFN